MKTNTRKYALTAHVISSVGWLGAVGAFLALAIAGLTNQDDRMLFLVAHLSWGAAWSH